MTKVISVSDEAYEALARIKDRSSFSEVILEITKEKSKNDIMKFAGAWKSKNSDKIAAEIVEERKGISRRAQ